MGQHVRRKWPALVAGVGVLVAMLSLASMQAQADIAPMPTGLAAQNAGLAPVPAVAPAANTVAGDQAQPYAAASHSVMIMNYAFSPASLTVAVGDTVTWTNEDTAPHTVTVSSGPVMFASSNLQKGQSFTYTFSKPGTYAYYCAVHPDMKASVTVTGSTPVPPSSPPPSSAPPSSSPPASAPPTGGGGSPCTGLDAAVTVFLQHFYAAHLEEGPGQQVGDILQLDQYVKTHTVLVEHLIQPLVGGSNQALTVFLEHVYAAHLEASPGQQVADIANLDQYVKTHTVLIEHMIQPLAGGNVSSC
ncbi:cupredoxin family copper-binding protein [Fodinicola feengrottensis]|uniref:Cupredoxin family copper-binding protein n=2 Tax=Fodinicola feengrottensis TaxID=435914 RepID=A0ABN2J1M4_9ACTN